jgi:hypothetical protein
LILKSFFSMLEERRRAPRVQVVEQLKTMRGISLLKVATIMPIAAPPA